ncbi:COG4705 family protein [Deinococcus ruber]|uniref:Membrane-anchored protein n=1 Tax=Deinococcus ruber TaxID=1848197 RepID=A0A918F820_9DEIO|nr:hypothetical protein [Deinococcus ruber]GGR17875.1 hypothetical protein GCM10008957_33280 [Deinococcus ruber]
MTGKFASLPTSLRRSKVPEVTALFWVIKVLTTGMGEAAADFLGQQGLWLAAGIGGVGLVAALVWQFRATHYQPLTYWSTVSWVAVFGTVAADVVGHNGLDLPLTVTTTGYAVGVVAVFFFWYRTEHTLSVHSISTPRREAFYWLTVLLSFALGTAAGDLTAFVLGLGFATSAVMFAAAIAVPWVLYRRRLIGEVPAFWSAYVLTRPLGASVADWLGKGSPRGLGLGDGVVTLGALALIALLVGQLIRSRAHVQTDARAYSH